MYTIKPIGVVKSPVLEPQDEDWGKVISEIQLNEELTSGLQGLNEFSHALIIYYLHQASFELGNDLIRKPQGIEELPLTGIFAQRAKHRPNPIGVTAVKILEVSANTLTVQGLDAIDGTPVIDIKPYFPVFDRRDASVPRWVEVLMKKYF